MKAPKAPRLETRRAVDFSRELRDRTQAWMPSWDITDGQGDFGLALLDIAARFSSEVAERLDRAGEKMRAGLLDWLGVRGKAARPARMPVVFKLSDSAQEVVPAPAPIRLQVDAAGTPVIFETEKGLDLVPARLEVIAAVDPAIDAYYLPPPDLSSLNPVEHLPTQWKLKNFAPARATTLQLSPELGLAAGIILDVNGQQYRIVSSDKDLITIDPGLNASLKAGVTLSKIVAFTPFGAGAQNRQSHELYLGDSDLLNLEAAAKIAVVGAATLRAGITWQYWGKKGKGEAGWQGLTVAPSKEQTVPDAIVLDKPAGSMEPKEIAGHSARWIRAYAQTVKADKDPFTADDLKILINPSPNCAADPCPPGAGATPPHADGMANTTPVVLDSLFFPLGKEPRQFDAFYLGSNEAFSKKGANAQLCFEMADRTFSSLSAVRGIDFGSNRVLVGVGKDQSLYLLLIHTSSGAVSRFLDRPPLQPLQNGSPVLLDKSPAWKPPVWTNTVPPQMEINVAVSSGRAIWVRKENLLNPGLSQWISFGQLPPDGDPTALVAGLIQFDDNQQLSALRGSQLYIRQADGTWKPIPTTAKLASIEPVLVQGPNDSFSTKSTEGMVGIDANGKLFHVSIGGACTPILPTDKFSQTIRPVAVKLGADLVAVAALDAAPHAPVADKSGTRIPADLTGIADSVLGLEPMLSAGKLHLLASGKHGSDSLLLDWAPLESATDVFSYSIPGANVQGPPTQAAGLVVVPGANADILSASFTPQDRLLTSSAILPGVVLPDSVNSLDVNDLVVRFESGKPVARTVQPGKRSKDGETLYPLDDGFKVGAKRLDVYRLSTTPKGSITAGVLTLDPADEDTFDGTWLLFGSLGTDLVQVNRVDRTTTPATATLIGPTPTVHHYIPPESVNGRIAPYLDLLPSGNGNWDASLLDRIPIQFPDLKPRIQRAKAFRTSANHPMLVVLGAEFQSPFSYLSSHPFLVDSAVGDWHRDLSDTAGTPELSWEYWNGTGWSKLKIDTDSTFNLKITGSVRFTIPDDLLPSDWAGKTNPWIRARLIGGDYGREKVSFNSVTGVVTRSTDDIRPPSVLKLTISYGFCTAVLPAFLLTSDSGSVRDQSNANRSSGAIVEAFVPLAVALGRLRTTQFPSTAPTPQIAPPCVCPGEEATASNAAMTGATAVALPVSLSMERCLFVGLSGLVSGETVNILLLVDSEQSYTQFAPLTVEALVANQFVPIVASDGTRAIGESGVISMSFAVPPASADLFGKPLIWLRLAPKSAGDWKPSIRGAYLNAAFASARETLTRELVGSSEGAPGLTFTLARPPLLHDTLELRVREPLGDEERADLLEQGLVISDPDDLPGDWVRWKQVPDPADQSSSSRVYALDEDSGEIRFGDGIQGMIPPIGRDSIVAFSYQRTEPPLAGTKAVPGNLVGARTTLNLVSPVETVESVTSAENSAGGAAPESGVLVLQFGYARIRHRDRALTLRDFEDIALESSPTIIQARAFLNPGGKIVLIAVMRGKDPRPNAAQVRELRRYLLSFAPAALAAPGVLTIAAPKLRYLRLALNLDIPTLDVAVDLSKFVKSALAALFDGWTLGQNPTDDDIATVLAPAPGLRSVVDISLREVAADGDEVSWPDHLKPTELAVLAADPVRLQLHSLEVSV